MGKQDISTMDLVKWNSQSFLWECIGLNVEVVIAMAKRNRVPLGELAQHNDNDVIAKYSQYEQAVKILLLGVPAADLLLYDPEYVDDATCEWRSMNGDGTDYRWNDHIYRLRPNWQPPNQTEELDLVGWEYIDTLAPGTILRYRGNNWTVSRYPDSSANCLTCILASEVIATRRRDRESRNAISPLNSEILWKK